MMGKILFFVFWPFVWFYAPLRIRVRAVVRCGDELLLVKNWFGPGKWQLPGGGMKMGEQAIATARRELQEELDLSLPGKPDKFSPEPVIIRQFGLLYRCQFVYWQVDFKPELKVMPGITHYDWLPAQEAAVQSAEVRAAL